MKSNLSHILPVSEACGMVGTETVDRLVRSFLHFRTPNRDINPEDVTVLVKALLYDPGENDVPQNIQINWNRLTRRTSGMDKPSFLAFMVPNCAAPFNGPGGHFGLYDCWVHALSAAANNYAVNSSPSLQPIVLLPDVLVVVAVCREYKHVQSLAKNDSVTESLANRHDYAIMMLSMLAFRVYDSYQKKGTVTRDTIHRFMSDVHGEDSYKQTHVRKVLDMLFTAPTEEDEPRFLSTLTPGQFANGIRKTMRGKHHILLDWIATLGSCMIPQSQLPKSTLGYLDSLISTNRSMEKLCHQYGFATLYEIKRRFHSLVETNQAIQGEAADIMKEEGSGKKPRHAISEAAFLKAVTLANDDFGSGGHLPESLALATFAAGASPSEDGVSAYWALYDVLHFGFLSVRQANGQGDVSPEIPLLKFVFKVFVANSTSTRMMRREQIGKMLLLLLEHNDFRLKRDRPPYYDDDDKRALITENNGNLEEMLIDTVACAKLGISPPEHTESSIPMKRLIDRCLLESRSNDDGLTFPGFCQWHATKDDDLPPTQRRLGPFMMELRLMASILFGIPPTKASMEDLIILEIQRRHKCRYPQTDVSRRGPRGTIWYIIDNRWFKAWAHHIQQVAGSESDIADGRQQEGADPRGLTKINNTFLLADNGSLALKPDIRWRHDYEIVPPLAWSALQAWYDGGPPIHRSVVRYIPSNGAPSVHSKRHTVRTENEIELYPFFVTIFLCDSVSKGQPRPFQQSAPVSRVSPLRVLLVQLCKGLDVDPRFGRLWMMEKIPNEENDEEGLEDWLLNLDQNIIEQRNRQGQEILGRINLLLELKDVDSGKWPRGIDGKSWTFEEKRFGEIKHINVDVGDGVVGLYNMGNTCYLNSSIQCLSHTPIFRDYFNSKVYLHDINRTNPLGHQGKLAQVSAVLINSIWKRCNQPATHTPKRNTAPGLYNLVHAPALTPKTFTESLGRFNDHFAGNEQHDAQELLAFLLGGLSEDLNRIVEKPYIEAPDSDGRPDSELADIWWSNHLQREFSIIVALFTGQYKSLLTCRSCKYESARFEPFSFLQLPLPEDDQISVSLIFYPIKDDADTLKYSIRVRHDGKLIDVLVSLAKVLYADETGKIPGANTGDEMDPDVEARARSRAKNIAVVDMREGYIFKIAPNNWSLQDLQNKDTGEVPLLHAYELDPLPEPEVENPGTLDEIGGAREDIAKKADEDVDGEDEETDEEDEDDVAGKRDKTVDGDKKKTGYIVKSIDESADRPLQGGEESDEDYEEDKNTKHSFLAFAQRKTEVSSRELLHPFTHRVFGTPLLLRVNNLDEYSGNKLYDLVANRMKNIVPKSAMRFLSGSESRESNGSIPDTAKKSSSAGVSNSRRIRTLSEAESVAAGPLPRYGFRLRMTSRDGRRCSLCPWYQCCIGCLVPDDDRKTMVTCGDSIAIDWHFAVDIASSGFGVRLTQDQSGPQSPLRIKNQPTVCVKNHASCNDDAKKKGYGGSITLEDCLDAFAKEEKIPEAYCSRCKDFRVQTKRMSLWRLPPIVIIHLKRFQFTQHMRRKLRDLVIFPVEGLDLARIVASDTLQKDPSQKTSAYPSNSSIPSETDATEENTVGDTSLDSNEGEEKKSNGSESMKEKDVSKLLSSANNTGRDEMLYDLYAVVHHQGALSGGHYVASVKSEIDGQWRLFNDAQVYELHAKDVVDSSAYILFYIRRDAKSAHLHNFWDINARTGEGMTEEEVEKLMNGRSEKCTIS